MPDPYDKLIVNVIHTTPPLYPGDWWYLDNGLPVPPPEPTPAERAFAILEPHLAGVPLYRPTWQHGARGGMFHGVVS